MTLKTQFELMQEANNLAGNLLAIWQELNEINSHAIGRDLNTFIETSTELSRINRVLNKSIERCKRRANLKVDNPYQQTT